MLDNIAQTTTDATLNGEDRRQPDEQMRIISGADMGGLPYHRARHGGEAQRAGLT